MAKMAPDDAPSFSLYALWKPTGITVEQASAPTHGAEGRKLVLNDFIEKLPPSAVPGGRVSAVGRLDKETDGLMLLTDNGVLAERLLRPGAVPKVYEATVRLRKPLRPTDEQLDRLRAGVELAGIHPRAASASWQSQRPSQPRDCPSIYRHATGSAD